MGTWRAPHCSFGRPAIAEMVKKVRDRRRDARILRRRIVVGGTVD